MEGEEEGATALLEVLPLEVAEVTLPEEEEDVADEDDTLPLFVEEDTLPDELCEEADVEEVDRPRLWAPASREPKLSATIVATARRWLNRGLISLHHLKG